MMQPINVPAAAARASSNGPAGESTVAGEGFMARLSQSLEDLTGREVSGEQIVAWLDGNPPDGMPTGAELAALLQQLLPDSPGDVRALAAPERDGEIDVAALLAALVAAGGGRGGDTPLQRAGELSSGLHDGNPAMLRQLIDGLKPAVERADGEGFRKLMATIGALEDNGRAATQAQPQLQAQTTPPSVTLKVPQSVGQPGFSQGVGQQVTWMVRNGVQTATVQLDPPDLGPLEIAVTMRDDRTMVAIHAHHAATREALAADSARLRAVLVDNGFSGVDVSVREERPDSGSRESFADSGDSGGRSPTGGDEEIGHAPATADAVQLGRGLVDHYV